MLSPETVLLPLSQAGRPFHKVDIAVPEVLIGGLLGVMMVFFFTGLAVSAVGTTAEQVVAEVGCSTRVSLRYSSVLYTPSLGTSPTQGQP